MLCLQCWEPASGLHSLPLVLQAVWAKCFFAPDTEPASSGKDTEPQGTLVSSSDSVGRNETGLTADQGALLHLALFVPCVSCDSKTTACTIPSSSITHSLTPQNPHNYPLHILGLKKRGSQHCNPQDCSAQPHRIVDTPFQDHNHCKLTVSP